MLIGFEIHRKPSPKINIVNICITRKLRVPFGNPSILPLLVPPGPSQLSTPTPRQILICWNFILMESHNMFSICVASFT